SRHDDLLAAAEVVGSLKETPPPKNRGADEDLWIYKGPESIGRKLREVILSSDTQILCVSPFPVAPEILRLLFDALGRSRRLVRVVLSESNRADLAEFGSLLSRNVRVQFRFPARPLSKTRLAHTYVFPSDHEVFILNSFYRHAHRDASPHDLEDAGLQGLRQHRVRLHVRDPDRLREGQIANPGLAGVPRSLLDLQFLRNQGGRRRRPDLDREGFRLWVDE